MRSAFWILEFLFAGSYQSTLQRPGWGFADGEHAFQPIAHISAERPGYLAGTMQIVTLDDGDFSHLERNGTKKWCDGVASIRHLMTGSQLFLLLETTIASIYTERQV